jgi:hypothetical protein
MFPAFVLLIVVVAYRIVAGFAAGAGLAWMHNFAPVAAVALCGAIWLPRRMAVLLPLAMLFLSDVVLNVWLYHWPLLTFELLPRYAALACISALGFALRGRARLPLLVGASLAGSVIFYLITNTGSWIGEPGYAKTAAGWWQAVTTGLPGYPPTWTFYRYTLVGDLVFTLLFAGCMSWQARAQKVPTPAAREELVPW